jgi:hypothetical protein
MNDEEDSKDIKTLLRAAIAPVQDAELRRDLWPQMLRKLDEQSLPVNQIPWFDWALAALLGAVLFFFPGTIPALLYHL